MSRWRRATAAASRDARKRLNESPLGAAALAGTVVPDRSRHDREGARLRPADGEFARRRLRPRLRAGDTRRGGDRGRASVAFRRRDRDLDARRSSGLVRLSDRFTTGSSIMPQKRNPDAAELVRAKTGRIIGALQALLMVMKGLPLAYQKDMQEDKEGAIDALSALGADARRHDRDGARHDARYRAHAQSRRRGLLHRDRSRRLAGADLKMPFREAHHVTGRIVAKAAKDGVALHALPLEAMRAIEPRITEERVRRALGGQFGEESRAAMAAPRRRTCAAKPTNGSRRWPGRTDDDCALPCSRLGPVIC